MTEEQYRKLVIDTIRVGDYAEKDALIELLKISAFRFNKTDDFTYHLWNHGKNTYMSVLFLKR